MATEIITLNGIKTRGTSDYDWMKSGQPMSGYSEVVGPPISSVVSSDASGVTIDTTVYFEGRLCKPEFRIAKDLKALADIVENLNSPSTSGPKKFVLISENDTEAGYLDTKIIDGEGTLSTIISESDGIEELKIDVRTKKTIEIDNDELQLDGDELSPGSLHYYGTNVAGRKGWYGFTEIPMPAVTITDQDNSSDYLNEKLSDGEGILKTITETSNGEQTLDLSVRVQKSIDITSDILELENDVETPGNSKFYGTTTLGVKGWQSLPVKESIEEDSNELHLDGDEASPGNSKFYGTTTLGVKGWQDIPIKNSLEQDSEEIQLVNDENAPGTSRYYGTDFAGNKGWHVFSSSTANTVSIAIDDATSGFLNDKLVDGEGITQTQIEESTGGAQQLQLDVNVKNSIDIDSDYLQLVNDENAPAASKFYGTDDSGTKGWHDFIDADKGVTSITVGDASSGYLDDKIVDGDGISSSILTDGGGNQTLDLAVNVKNSIEIDSDSLQLVNDETSPGNAKFYGTDNSGTKGWLDFPEVAGNTLSISASDTDSDYLDSKLIDGVGILTTINSDSTGLETLDISVRVQKSIEIDNDFLQLENDETSPGNAKFYGTDNSGVKGWIDFPEVAGNTISITGSDTNSGYLDDKIIDGDGILATVLQDTTGLELLDLSVRVQKSIDINSDILELENDVETPGNSKFYGTSVAGVKGWQALPIKNSIELDSEQLQLVNDSNTPGVLKYYGTNIDGTKGFYPLAGGAISVDDDTPGYLEDKLLGIQSISITTEADSAFDEILEVTLLNDESNPGTFKFYGTDENGVKGWHEREYTTNTLGLGGLPDIDSVGNTFPVFRRCDINPSTGAISNIGTSGNDIVLSGDGASADQQIIASRVWNAVWNDMADFQELADSLIYGKCYYDTLSGAKICNERCQESVIGIASNTFGYALGSDKDKVPIAVSGWVLACVDKEYKPGTPLTNNENGELTEMNLDEKRNYPERLVAIYKKKESQDTWGPVNQSVLVDNRHWVKIK